MENTRLYQDIAKRTDGDIYVGVVGPVRTGKSTFIKRFMDLLVIPNIDNEYKKERARDELPQSAGGRTIMTTEPKFVPNEAIEITLNDNIIIGDIYIGTGETDGVRLMAMAARKLQEHYPGIHYHISSGNASHVMEQLDKGLIDFGMIFGEVDLTKYNTLETSYADQWGVLMRKDSALAQKESILPKDLRDKPLILSQQESKGGTLTQWLGREARELNIIATYNLLFNASLLVEEGLGYAIGYDKIINTSGDSRLCFRPLMPHLESHMHIIWKKYQMFSKPAEKFLEMLKNILNGAEKDDHNSHLSHHSI